jgi:hypothetical protein
MAGPTDKARALRIQRLASMLSTGLTNPASALDALIAELTIGEAQAHLWEGMHAAASTENKERALGDAYRNMIGSHRFKQMDASVRAQVLVHAAHFSQGMLGDGASAEQFLMQALAAVPDHTEAFSRLEIRFEALPDKRRLLALYAASATRPPKPAAELGSKAVNLITPMPATMPLPESTCVGLAPLAAAAPSLITALEAHCQKTGRPALACAVIERALENKALSEHTAVDFRRRVVQLFLDHTKTPERAVDHVEALLVRDPQDAVARAAAKRMVAIRSIGDQVTSLLQELRRQGRLQ